MPRKILKRFLPDHHRILKHKQLKIFGGWLHNPNLWHLNRRSVAGAFSVGLLVAFVPIPFQMLLAAAIALATHVNLPIAVSLVWISNPLTMPALFYFAYKVGAWMLSVPTHSVQFELSIDWLMTKLGDIWQPFLLGCLVLGLLSATLGNIIIRGFWRMHVINNWRNRRQRRKQLSRH